VVGAARRIRRIARGLSADLMIYGGDSFDDMGAWMASADMDQDGTDDATCPLGRICQTMSTTVTIRNRTP